MKCRRMIRDNDRNDNHNGENCDRDDYNDISNGTTTSKPENSQEKEQGQ